MIPFELNENAFQALQSVTFNPNPLPEFEERPRFGRHTRRQKSSDSFNFRVVDWKWNLALTHDRKHPRRYEDRQTLLRIELAEYVTREQRSIHLSQFSIPVFLSPVGWK